MTLKTVSNVLKILLYNRYPAVTSKKFLLF